ncbi:hypothetical protein [Halobellus marinus]|uniref:hypothetical protein n=1 Tax=Halobellus TaxID=1073986 RepID=UPI0028A9964B|nr:hypothetical protein [Halobellus sp. DFY28]
MTSEPVDRLKEKYGDIDRIVVDPEDVIEAISYAEEPDGSQMSQGSKVLRVWPPFEGCVKADVFFNEAATRYPSNIEQPLHISPFAFLNEDAGFRKRIAYPNWLEISRKTAEARDSTPEEVDEEAVEENYDLALEDYHRQIRKRLADEITPDNRCGYTEQALAGISVEYREEET